MRLVNDSERVNAFVVFWGAGNKKKHDYTIFICAPTMCNSNGLSETIDLGVLPLHKPYENLKQFMNGEAFGPCLSDPNVKETESRPCKLSSMFVRGFSRGV